MCSNPNPAPKDESANPQRDELSGIASALQYTPPVWRENAGNSYIEFYAFDPEIGKLRRKRIKTNRIKGVVKRRQYVRDVLRRLNEQLSRGWNPWIAKDTANLDIFADALERYSTNLDKMLESGYYRKETYNGYKSYVKILGNYAHKINPIYYVYQFDRKFCVDFLDHIFIERDNGAQTRNNYLNFLRLFSGYLVDKGFLKSRPTDGIAPISKRLYKKERTVIPADRVRKITEYCKVHDPHFLLACYLLYYCFIRPVEMTRLRVRDLNLKAGTITIPASCSKNKQQQTVTVPKKVLKYCLDLGIFHAPMSDFIFSENWLRPGSEAINPKIFRDHWRKLREPLGLRSEWKFYSLKDTGITEMLRAKVPTIEVRDQARHSSLAMTEIYTDHSEDVNPEVVDYEGSL